MGSAIGSALALARSHPPVPIRWPLRPHGDAMGMAQPGSLARRAAKTAR